MRAFLRSAVLSALLLLAWPLAPIAAVAAEAAKPNIVILLADDMGYADAGFQGCKDIPTPHLDSLAQSGVRCTSGYVSGPYCSPTRAGLMTGRYQTRFGHEFNPGGGPEMGLPTTETTLADRLKAAGYATGLVGKWHLGSAPKFHPERRGFDEFFGFLGGAHTYFAENTQTILRGTKPAREKEYLTDAFGREAVAFIERHKDRPFFLYLAFNAVHTPMEATEDRLARFASIEDRRRRTYAAMTSAMDEAIGRVLAALQSRGLDEKTLVFFLSDNGGPTMPGTTINGSSNAPLRGSKRTTLEGGIRVPFVVRWKGTLPGGRVYQHPVIQLDILPTALAAAGVEPKAEWKLDGVSLLPYLLGHNLGQPHDTLYWRFGPQMAIRRGDWKLVRYDVAADGQSGNSPKGRQPGVTSPKLYNLAEDIGESRDVAAEHPEKVQELQSAWQAWSAEQADPLWGAGQTAKAKAAKGKGAKGKAAKGKATSAAVSPSDPSAA
jgi:arylsulfatase A-like enzyme